VEQAGSTERDPQPALPGAADEISAALFAFGIVSALHARHQTGEGQQVQVSLLGSMINFQGRQITRFMRSGRQGRPRWRRSPTYSHYRAADGWVAIAAVDPKMWPGLCNALDRPDLVTDPRFAGPWDRDRNAAELESQFEVAFAQQPQQYWLDGLIANDVPCGPVAKYADVVENPQVLANGYITSIDHPNLGPLRTTGVPIHLSGTPPPAVRPAPELGQHTEEVLLDLGFDWDTIEVLRRDNVI
jgi:crotonobetainyl-CoA:carnitine CoA-transferase CaiB-like acyl-CoA transferase